MEIKLFGDGKYTKTLVDCEGTCYILLTPEFIERFEKMEKFLELNYRYHAPEE